MHFIIIYLQTTDKKQCMHDKDLQFSRNDRQSCSGDAGMALSSK